MYILKSHKNNQYYIGSTSNLDSRLVLHNTGKVKSTRLYRPWSIYYFEKFQDYRNAILRERQVKGWKSRAMIEKLKLS